MSKPTLISVAYAGGQGKTTVAQLLYIASQQTYGAYRLVSADCLDDTGHSKLGRLYPLRVDEIGTGASITAARQENDNNAGLRYWDRHGKIFLQGGSIIDVGANVFPSIVEWAADRRLSQLMERAAAPKVDFCVVCKPEINAVEDTVALISQLQSRKPFDIGRIFVFQNEAGGSFAQFDLAGQLARRCSMDRIKILNLQRCHSELWQAMEARGMSIEEACTLEVDSAMSRLGVDMWTASAGLAELRDWVDRTVAMMVNAGVFPSEEMRKLRRVPTALAS